MNLEIIHDGQAWNETVRSRGGSFLQSWEWGALQENLGRRILRVSQDELLASILVYELPFKQSYLYLPRGPAGLSENSFDSLSLMIKTIQNCTVKERPIFLRVEPQMTANSEYEEKLKRIGFRKTKPVQPTTTLILDLTKTEEELLAEMEHDTRYSIRSSQKKGVRVIHLKTLEEKKKYFDDFWRLFSATNRRHFLQSYSRQYYQEIFQLNGICRSEVLIAQIDGEIVSAAVFIIFGQALTYLYAASDFSYRKFNAPSLIIWNGILLGKKNDCRVFDFWGINRDSKKWQGITAFKMSFGGQVIDYPGTWDWVLNKKLYFLYKIAKLIKR